MQGYQVCRLNARVGGVGICGPLCSVQIVALKRGGATAEKGVRRGTGCGAMSAFVRNAVGGLE